MLVSKENMRWYKDNNIKRAANKTLCFAVQWLNFPKQAQSQKLTIFEYGQVDCQRFEKYLTLVHEKKNVVFEKKKQGLIKQVTQVSATKF